MGDKNIWQIAEEECKMMEYEKGQDGDRSVLFTGGKSAGKTTGILQFLGRAENAKPTIALEYTFARRSTQLKSKLTGHIWELGGGTFLTKLLDVPISAKTIQHLAVVLVVDLSQPQTLWYTIETLLHAIKLRLEVVIQQESRKDIKFQQKLMEKAWKRIGGKDITDNNVINPFPVPLVIIGSKYDLFQSMDSEERKMITKVLRFLAHINGATLLFTSDKIESTVRGLRHVMNYAAFDGELSKSAAMDEKKPIYIPAGMDSLETIGNPSDSGRMSAKNPTDAWRNIFCSRFPQQGDNRTSVLKTDDPAKDAQFLEPMIDEARAQKDRELEAYRRQEKNKWTRI